MTYQVCYWDSAAGVQRTRAATPEETAEIDARKTAPAPAPEILTPRQFRQALTHFTFRATVEAAISASDQDTKDWYAYASQFERHHPKTLAVAQQMAFTPDQMDQVWTYGAAL